MNDLRPRFSEFLGEPVVEYTYDWQWEVRVKGTTYRATVYKDGAFSLHSSEKYAYLDLRDSKPEHLNNQVLFDMDREVTNTLKQGQEFHKRVVDVSKEYFPTVDLQNTENAHIYGYMKDGKIEFPEVFEAGTSRHKTMFDYRCANHNLTYLLYAPAVSRFELRLKGNSYMANDLEEVFQIAKEDLIKKRDQINQLLKQG